MPSEEMEIIRILVSEELHVSASVLEPGTDLRDFNLDCELQEKFARNLMALFDVEFGDEEHLGWFTIQSIVSSLQYRQDLEGDRSKKAILGDTKDDLYRFILEVVATRLGILPQDLSPDTNLWQKFGMTPRDQAGIAHNLVQGLSKAIPSLDIGEREYSRWQTPKGILATLEVEKILCELRF